MKFKVKACPFCGCFPHIGRGKDTDTFFIWKYYIACWGCVVGFGGDTAKECVALWNDRHIVDYMAEVDVEEVPNEQ